MPYQYKFLGSLGQLKELVKENGFAGSWRFQRLCTCGIKHMFKGKDGAVLNFWESSNTVTFQGTPQASQSLFNCMKSHLQEKPREKFGQSQDNAGSFEYDE